MTYHSWLKAQRDKDTPIGDLARDAARDPRMRRPFTSIEELVRYLRGRGACTDAVRAACESWIAWHGSIGRAGGL